MDSQFRMAYQLKHYTIDLRWIVNITDDVSALSHLPARSLVPLTGFVLVNLASTAPPVLRIPS